MYNTGHVEDPEHDLFDALSALHHGGKYSDLTIECDGRQWSVHRAIVCPRSAFFDAACSNDFVEAGQRMIRLDDDDHVAVEQMIKFFYHLDYLQDDHYRPTVFRHRAETTRRNTKRRKLDLASIEDPLLQAAGCYHTPECTPEPEKEPPMDLDDIPPAEHSSPIQAGPERGIGRHDDDAHLVLHAKVYALAEKYDIPALKVLARRKFEAAIACNYDSPDLPEAIEEVYSSTVDTDKGLRHIVLRVLKAHPRLATTTDVYDVIKHNPDLAQALYRLEKGHAIGA